MFLKVAFQAVVGLRAVGWRSGFPCNRRGQKGQTVAFQQDPESAKTSLNPYSNDQNRMLTKTEKLSNTDNHLINPKST